MNTKDTRPFCLKDARQGAPYATRGGKIATVLKWDSRNEMWPLVGVYGEDDRPTHWTAAGMFGASTGTFSEDLVMKPLGYIEGRPFFSGDLIVGATGKVFTAEPRDQDGSHDLWRWPLASPLVRMTLDTAFRDRENQKLRDARDLAIAEKVRYQCENIAAHAPTKHAAYQAIKGMAGELNKIIAWVGQ